MPAANDEPIDHVDDARRAIRRKIDSLTDASNTFRERRGVNPEDVAGAVDQVRERVLEAAVLLEHMIREAEVAEFGEELAGAGLETIDGEKPTTGDSSLREELSILAGALREALDRIDGKRDDENRVRQTAEDSIESWARQRRGDTDPRDRIDLDGVDAPIPPPPNPHE